MAEMSDESREVPTAAARQAAPPALVPLPPADMLPEPIARPTLARRRSAPARARDDISTRRLLEEDIGLPELQAALEYVAGGAKGADSDSETISRLRQMLEKMSDPAFAAWSITQIAKDCGVRAADLVDAETQRVLGIAKLQSARKAGKVLEDLSEDAQSRLITCDRCRGEGEVPPLEWMADKPRMPAADLGEEELRELITCPKCEGLKKVRVEAPIERVKLFLALHGLAAKGGNGQGLVINNTAQAAAKADSAGNGQNSVPVTEKVQKIIDL